MDRLGFIRQFARSPIKTGAVAASSRPLARLITEQAQVDTAKVVLELGPGTGAITECIMESKAPYTRFLALEINPAFVEATRRRCPDAQVRMGDAVHARQYLEDMGENYCDTVVSGLPWASFTPSRQDLLLRTIRDILRPGGRFLTFAYVQGLILPPARRFEKQLRTRFRRVRTTPVVWRNLPPAFIYISEK